MACNLHFAYAKVQSDRCVCVCNYVLVTRAPIHAYMKCPDGLLLHNAFIRPLTVKPSTELLHAACQNNTMYACWLKNRQAEACITHV